MKELETRAFYNETPIDIWKQILGEDMHYHFGMFNDPADDFQFALKNGIRSFYRWIPDGSRILDLGAGWGGPAAMYVKEKHAKVLCVTNSDVQVAYIKELGLKVVQHDLETPLSFASDAAWDITTMMESVEHIRHKKELLAEARRVSGRLILRASCTNYLGAEEAIAFNGSMIMPRQDELLALLGETGWNVRFICNRRYQSFLSFVHWRAGIDRLFKGRPLPTAHLMALSALCDQALRSPEPWMAMNPLIDIVAD